MNSLSSDLYPEVRLLCHFYLVYEPLVLSIMSEPLSTPSHPPASTISNPSDNSHSDFHFSDNQRSSALFSDAHCSHECLLLRNVSSDLLPALHQTIATAVAATDTEFLVFLQMLDSPQQKQVLPTLPYFFRVVCSSCWFPDWGWHVVIWSKLVFFLFLSFLPVVWGSCPKTCKRSDVLLRSFGKQHFKVWGHI